MTALIAPKSTQPEPVPIVKELTVSDEIVATALLKYVVEPVKVDKYILPRPFTVDCNCELDIYPILARPTIVDGTMFVDR